MAELFKPTSTAFTELWMDGGEKVAKMEYWRKDIDDKAVQVRDELPTRTWAANC